MTRGMVSVVEVFVELDFNRFEKFRLLGEKFLVGIVGGKGIKRLAGLVEAGELALPHERVAGLAAGDRLHAFALRKVGAGSFEGGEVAFEFEEFFFLTDIELLENAHGDRHGGVLGLLEKLLSGGRQSEAMAGGKVAQRMAVDIRVDRMGAGD